MQNVDTIYLHGYTQPHTAKLTTAYLQANNIKVYIGRLNLQIYIPLNICGMSSINVYGNVSHFHRHFHGWHDHSKPSGLRFLNVWFVIFISPWVENAKLILTLTVIIQKPNFQWDLPVQLGLSCLSLDLQWTVFLLCDSFTLLFTLLLIASWNIFNYCQANLVLRFWFCNTQFAFVQMSYGLTVKVNLIISQYCCFCRHCIKQGKTTTNPLKIME